ncbi:hypothetical protein CI109_100544 [Kwoniella shandongensis]|uniref:Uncharacterized protein n=1 Tax=Kwoniella shandongensis TaxID=1734106 RepID=A0A5M6BZG2_9TREE|nr:uncharacterized protein CI109_003535 [Kwoniella shandongensis]KAA5528246.1 hypothetical protein CI109_003535 [Kwoniella shandongensis]
MFDLDNSSSLPPSPPLLRPRRSTSSESSICSLHSKHDPHSASDTTARRRTLLRPRHSSTTLSDLPPLTIPTSKMPTFSPSSHSPSSPPEEETPTELEAPFTPLFTRTPLRHPSTPSTPSSPTSPQLLTPSRLTIFPDYEEDDLDENTLPWWLRRNLQRQRQADTADNYKTLQDLAADFGGCITLPDLPCLQRSSVQSANATRSDHTANSSSGTGTSSQRPTPLVGVATSSAQPHGAKLTDEGEDENHRGRTQRRHQRGYLSTLSDRGRIISTIKTATTTRERQYQVSHDGLIPSSIQRNGGHTPFATPGHVTISPPRVASPNSDDPFARLDDYQPTTTTVSQQVQSVSTSTRNNKLKKTDSEILLPSALPSHLDGDKRPSHKRRGSTDSDVTIKCGKGFVALLPQRMAALRKTTIATVSSPLASSSSSYSARIDDNVRESGRSTPTAKSSKSRCAAPKKSNHVDMITEPILTEVPMFKIHRSLSRDNRPISPTLPDAKLNDENTHRHQTVSSAPKRPKSPNTAKESLEEVLSKHLPGSEENAGALDKLIEVAQKVEDGSLHLAGRPRPPSPATIELRRAINVNAARASSPDRDRDSISSRASTYPPRSYQSESEIEAEAKDLDTDTDVPLIETKPRRGFLSLRSLFPTSPKRTKRALSPNTLDEHEEQPPSPRLEALSEDQKSAAPQKRTDFDVDKISAILKDTRERVCFAELEGVGEPQSSSVEEEDQEDPVEVGREAEGEEDPKAVRPSAGRRWTFPW